MVTSAIIIGIFVALFIIVIGTLFFVSGYHEQKEEFFDEGEDRAYSVRSIPSSKIGVDNHVKKPYHTKSSNSNAKVK